VAACCEPAFFADSKGHVAGVGIFTTSPDETLATLADHQA
jgi:hypothetical protein